MRAGLLYVVALSACGDGLPDDAVDSDAEWVRVECGVAGEQIRPTTSPLPPDCTWFLGSLHFPDATGPELSAIDNLRGIDGRLSIFRNHFFPDLAGLERLEVIGGALSIRLDDSDDRFTSLQGARALREVGELEIELNRYLESLDGLANLQVVHGDVRIEDNLALPQADVDAFLARLEVGGTVTTGGNDG